MIDPKRPVPPRRRVQATLVDGEWAFRERVLGATDAVRQHYVPRSYLRQFADEDGNVTVLDLQTARLRRRHVNAVAFESDFYNLEILGRQASVEPWLAQVESRAMPVIRKVAADPGCIGGLTEEDEDDLARFMAAQWLRVPAFRNWNHRSMEAMRTQMRPMLLRGLRQLPHLTEAQAWEQMGMALEVTRERDAALTAAMLSETQGLANILQAMSWTAGAIAGGRLLYTSDNPVARFLTPVRPWWESGGFEAWNYSFPLSPNTLLKVDPFTNDHDAPRFRGPRGQSDFGPWDASWARHMLSREATRYVIGSPPFVLKECATNCIKRISAQKLADARQYHGFDPNPPPWPTGTSAGSLAANRT